MTNAKRRGPVGLHKRGRGIKTKFRHLIAKTNTNKINGQVLTEGNQGLWKGIQRCFWKKKQ